MHFLFIEMFKSGHMSVTKEERAALGRDIRDNAQKWLQINRKPSVRNTVARYLLDKVLTVEGISKMAYLYESLFNKA